MSTVRELIPKKIVGKEARNLPRTVWPFTHDFDEFFENVFKRAWMEPFGFKRSMMPEWEGPLSMRYPLIDMIDRDDLLFVRAELPGIKKEEIELTLTDEGLGITVDRELKEEEKAERFYRCELAHGALERFVPFPVEVDLDKAKAELKEGVLEVKIPKAKKAKKHVLKVA